MIINFLKCRILNKIVKGDVYVNFVCFVKNAWDAYVKCTLNIKSHLMFHTKENNNCECPNESCFAEMFQKFEIICQIQICQTPDVKIPHSRCSPCSSKPFLGSCHRQHLDSLGTGMRKASGCQHCDLYPTFCLNKFKIAHHTSNLNERHTNSTFKIEIF